MQECRLHQEAGVQNDSLCRSYFIEPLKYPLLSEDKCLICSPPRFQFLPLTWKWHQSSPIRNPPAVSTHLTWTKTSHSSPSQKRELLHLGPAGRTNITNILKLVFEFAEARYRFWKKWGRAERKTTMKKQMFFFFFLPLQVCWKILKNKQCAFLHSYD